MDLFKTCGETSPIITAADFDISNDSESITSLLSLDQQILLLLNDVANSVYEVGAHFISAVVFQSREEGRDYIIRSEITVVGALRNVLPATLQGRQEPRIIDLLSNIVYAKYVSV